MCAAALTNLRAPAPQVTDALNSGRVAAPGIPYGLMRALLHSPAVMAELRGFVARGAGARAGSQRAALACSRVFVLHLILPVPSTNVNSHWGDSPLVSDAHCAGRGS